MRAEDEKNRRHPEMLVVRGKKQSEEGRKVEAQLDFGNSSGRSSQNSPRQTSAKKGVYSSAAELLTSIH